MMALAPAVSHDASLLLRSGEEGTSCVPGGACDLSFGGGGKGTQTNTDFAEEMIPITGIVMGEN